MRRRSFSDLLCIMNLSDTFMVEEEKNVLILWNVVPHTPGKLFPRSVLLNLELSEELLLLFFSLSMSLSLSPLVDRNSL